MKIDPQTDFAVHMFVNQISSKYDIAGAILYGSRARNTHSEGSDADVAVLLNGEHQKALRITLEMADIAYDVLLETGINISPLPIWIDQWEQPEKFTNPELLENIAREGIRL